MLIVSEILAHFGVHRSTITVPKNWVSLDDEKWKEKTKNGTLSKYGNSQINDFLLQLICYFCDRSKDFIEKIK